MDQIKYNMELLHSITDLVRVTVSIYETLHEKGLIDDKAKTKIQEQLVETIDHLRKTTESLGVPK